MLQSLTQPHTRCQRVPHLRCHPGKQPPPSVPTRSSCRGPTQGSRGYVKLSVRPRLKLCAVAAGMMAPELVCWPMSSKKTCKREAPTLPEVAGMPCRTAGLLPCEPESHLQRRCSQTVILVAHELSEAAEWHISCARSPCSCASLTICLDVGHCRVWQRWPLPSGGSALAVRQNTSALVAHEAPHSPVRGA